MVSSRIVFLTLCVGLSLAVVKFPKDQHMNFKFPPSITLPSSPGLPIGHLRPLGHHRRSSGEVKSISVAELKSSQPGIMKNLLDEPLNVWPAVDELTENSDEVVKVTQRFSKDPSTRTNMKLSQFLADAGSEEWLVDDVLSRAHLDRLVSPLRNLTCLNEDLLYVSSSFTSGATSADVMLSHTINNLQCVTSGRKDFIIMKSSPNVALSNQPQVLCEVLAQVDINPDLINLFEAPWLSAMTWQHATLYKGDCIYIPAGYLYHVMSYGKAESLSLNWHKKNKCSPLNKDDSNGDKVIRPLLCKSDEDNKLTFCPLTEEDNSKDRWRSLLMSLTDKDEILSRACFASLFRDQETARELYAQLGDIPLHYDTLKSLSQEKIKDIIKLSHSQLSIKVPADTGSHYHAHDEL